MSTEATFRIAEKISRKQALTGDRWFTWGMRCTAWKGTEGGPWMIRYLNDRVPPASMHDTAPSLAGASDIHVVYFSDEETPASQDLVSRPVHYARFKIEPITFIMENGLPFARGSAVKYVVRAGHKIYDGMTQLESELTDLEKAKRMIEMEIGRLKGEPVY